MSSPLLKESKTVIPNLTCKKEPNQTLVLKLQTGDLSVDLAGHELAHFLDMVSGLDLKMSVTHLIDNRSQIHIFKAFLRLLNFKSVFALIAVPARPTNLRQVRMTGLYVTVAWSKPLTTTTGIPDTSLLKYRVSSKRIGSVRKQIIFTSTSATLRLVGNSTYQIQVQAVKSFNMNVFGPWSERLTLKSNPSGRFLLPQSVKLCYNCTSED